jgi:hypothetical protein
VNTDKDVLLATLELIRKGVYTLDGDNLMKAAEITHQFNQYVKRTLEQAEQKEQAPF